MHILYVFPHDNRFGREISSVRVWRPDKNPPPTGEGFCDKVHDLTRRYYLMMIMKPLAVRLIVTPGTVFTKTFG